MKKILLILLTVLMVLPLSVLPAGAATASMTVAEFDKSPVATDLGGATIGGIKFDPLKYAYNPLGDLQIITLLEYGYPDDTALYLYIYNPQDIALNLRDRRYAVTLALGDEKASYNKYNLKILDMAGTDAHHRLWVKCRIDIKSDAIKEAFRDKDDRTYRLSELELPKSDSIQSYGIGGAWTYRGSKAGGDLTSEAKFISVIELELKPLVYRGDAMTGGKNSFIYDQINSVYFSMPKDFEEKNGEIKSIRCTWTEYDSGWILACKLQKTYDCLNKGAIGNQVTGKDKRYPFIFSQVNGPYTGPLDPPSYISIFCWNPKTNVDPKYYTDTLQWLVKYDGKNAEYGAMVETNLQEQMEAVWEAYCKGEDNYFSDGGKKHTVDIMSDQKFIVKNDDPNARWWQKIFGNGTMQTNNRAFQRVTGEALKDPEAQLFVDKSYKDELAEALKKATDKNDDLMVLHFASSQYYCIPVQGEGWAGREDTWVNDGKEDMHACKETVYMGFDIIQFTCEKDGEKVIVPVAATPINVIGKLQFFDKAKEKDLWWVILVIAILLLVVVMIFFPAIIPIVIQILLLPIKLLWWLLKAIGKGFAALFHKRE